ncbi:MAG TPA: LssY C-terminal domain-containing protein, partial [Terriglobia bacterium]|nr:LssY C-terminal domain-containing protein [Terriglobia bacterium]
MRKQAMSNPIDSPKACQLQRGSGFRCVPYFASFVMFFIGLAATFCIPVQGYSQAGAPSTPESGKTLYLRLEAPVSTTNSHLHQPVTARVVRDFATIQGVLVPIGSKATGSIQKLIPPMDPNDHARLLIRFDQVVIPRHPPITLTAHLTEVENARETVLPDGTIQGILEKNAAAGRMDGILGKLGSAGGEMEKVSGKTFGKVDTAIDFPAGTDLILTLDQPLAADSIFPPTVPAHISPALVATLQNLLSGAPQRAQSKTKKPGDPLNLIIVGNSDQILSAFKQAGWGEAKKLGAKSAVGTVRAMASDNSYEDAPVSQLYLFGRREDLAFEKMLDTFMKRHHLRLWRTFSSTSEGREIWLGASTHDIGLDVHLGVVSHAIDPDLDAERAKVGADLIAGGLVAAERLVSRPNPLSEG